MKWYLEHLAPADRVLIETLERAIEVGPGRRFTMPSGQTVVYVQSIDETYVRLRYGPGAIGELTIPRAIRKAAIAQARTLAELRRQGADV